MPVLLGVVTTNRPPPHLLLYSLNPDPDPGFLVKTDPHPRSRFLMFEQKFVKIIILIKNRNIYSSTSMKELPNYRRSL